MDGVGRKLLYAYDREGNRTSVTHPDNAVFTYSYDGLGRMTRVLEGPSYTDNDQLVTRYYYNAAGLRLSAVRGAGTAGFSTSHYYDGAGRLESMHHTVPDTHDLSLGFSYTPSSQIAQATRSNDLFSWTDHYNVTRGYAANGLNQYASAGPAAFEYDGRGNLTKSTASGVASTFHYDAENRLVGAGGNRSVNFRYDPLGRLFEVKGSGVTTTRFLYDGDALVAEYGSTGTLLRRYVHGPGVDERVALYEGAGTGFANRAYHMPDEHGSIVALEPGRKQRQGSSPIERGTLRAVSNETPSPRAMPPQPWKVIFTVWRKRRIWRPISEGWPRIFENIIAPSTITVT